MDNEILLSNEKFELAQENFDARNFNNAIAYCKQSLSLNPKNFQAMLLLAGLIMQILTTRLLNVLIW